VNPWIWPLFEGPRVWPDVPGQFGAIRKHDIHTGIDLYTYSGMPVMAVEPGVVVAIEDFTGPKAGSPWWLDTESVLVEGPSGVIVYGELATPKDLRVGQSVFPGTCLGCVKPVLRKDKGRPRHMLHFELLVSRSRVSVIWELGTPQPESLLDPTARLRATWEAVTQLKLEYSGTGPIW
jgi:murein DD-endopeptidase MepM/ murein hydrolase activator NlpD